MREKFGLSKESAQKIIKGAQNQHLIANMNVRTTVYPTYIMAFTPYFCLGQYDGCWRLMRKPLCECHGCQDIDLHEIIVL